MIVTARVLLLFLSLLGYFNFIRVKKKIEVCFIPVVVFSGIGIIIFVAGILNILKLTTIILFFIGIVMNKYFFRLIDDREYLKQISFFFLFMLILFFILKENIWIHYDNFSHWGLVAKEILESNQFPNFQSELIQFQSYSTGSASFIYYISKISGIYSEGFMSVAQSWIVLSSCYTFLIWFYNNSKQSILPIIIFCLGLFIVNIQPYDLLVDTLLTSLGLAAINLIVFYKKNLQDIVVPLGSILLFLLSVKTSGIFFVLSALALVILYSFKAVKRLRVKIWLQTLYVSLGLLFLNLLWKAHVSYVFVAGNNSKHSFNLASYKENLLDKGKSKIMEIIFQYFQRIFSFNNFMLLLFGAIIIILIYSIYTQKKAPGKHLIIFSGVIYIIYHMNLLAMYVVSMPYDEAKNLDSFERYDLTIILFVLGILLIYSLKYAMPVSKYFLCLTIVILIFFNFTHRESFHQFITVKSTADRYKIERQLKDISYEKGIPTLVQIKKKSVSEGYLWYLFRYDLHTKDVSIKYFNEGSPTVASDVQVLNIEY